MKALNAHKGCWFKSGKINHDFHTIWLPPAQCTHSRVLDVYQQYFFHFSLVFPSKSCPLVSSQMGMADIVEFAHRAPMFINSISLILTIVFLSFWQLYFFHSRNCISSSFPQYFSAVLAAHQDSNVDQHWAGFGFQSMVISVPRRSHLSWLVLADFVFCI